MVSDDNDALHSSIHRSLSWTRSPAVVRQSPFRVGRGGGGRILSKSLTLAGFFNVML